MQHSLSPEELRTRCQEIFRYAQAGSCVSGIIHDLNNYLGAIMAYADLVELDETLGAEPRRMLGEIHSAVAKSSELLNYLAVISRDARPNVNVADPGDLVLRTHLLRRHRLHVRDIGVETHLAPHLPTLTLDLGQMQLALLCLVLNAEERLLSLDPKEDGPRRLRLSVDVDGAGIRYKVWNSGPSIDRADVEHIFDPFTTGHGNGHLGLGLFTAREIAKAHRGSLEYDPEQGFVLFLPRDTGLSL